MSLQETQDHDWLTLTLSPSPPSSSHPPPPPPPSLQLPFLFEYTQLPPYQHQEPEIFTPQPSQEPKILVSNCEFPSQESSSESEPRPSKKPRKNTRGRKNVKTDTVPPPFPWATSKRAVLHTLDHLRSHGLTTVTGAVKCKRCHEQSDIAFNLEEKFNSVAQFIEQNKCVLHDRALESWNRPALPKCGRCGVENSLKPVIAKKRSINWLFLLLGQWIGCCNLQQLRYFCKHAMIHKTGAKDRLVYSAYLGLCKQLQPDYQGHYDL